MLERLPFQILRYITEPNTVLAQKQTHRVMEQNRSLHTLLFDKDAKDKYWRKEGIFSKWSRRNWMSASRKVKLDSIYHLAQN